MSGLVLGIKTESNCVKRYRAKMRMRLKEGVKGRDEICRRFKDTEMSWRGEHAKE